MLWQRAYHPLCVEVRQSHLKNAGCVGQSTPLKIMYTYVIEMAWGPYWENIGYRFNALYRVFDITP